MFNFLSIYKKIYIPPYIGVGSVTFWKRRRIKQNFRRKPRRVFCYEISLKFRQTKTVYLDPFSFRFEKNIFDRNKSMILLKSKTFESHTRCKSFKNGIFN
eukprot:UN27860